MDKIIYNIKKTNIEFDAVVGIKTGGAIISDYISNKLNIDNYKIKLVDKKYNCDKTPNDSLVDMYQLQYRITGKFDEHEVCEGIEDELNNKNIILIDEQIATGRTMNEAIKYLKHTKKANIIYPTCISFSKEHFKFSYKISYTLPGLVYVWPWGYDN